MERVVKYVDYDYMSSRKIINELCEKYPVLQQFSIGKSCAGREIPALKLNESNEYVLFAAAFHGSEHITSNILLLFLEELADAYLHNRALAGINVKKALGPRGIIFVPCVNPDGCEISIRGALGCGRAAGNIYKMCQGDFIHWNANLRGVDINHNFDAGWHELHALERKSGILGPAPTRFGGERPHSEPETQALVNLCKEHNIHHALALHSQGEVIYWSYNGFETKTSKRMAEIMAATSGYALDVPVGLASGGGFKDWFLKEYLRPAFTVEVGNGKNPLPITDAPKIYNDIREMLTISAIM
ncbi:MAG: M14 family metallocarboxypeptidase [Clostridia bacterium]|nr:M14 family metallocarboxypeptidase [Clostridia bacterium]